MHIPMNTPQKAVEFIRHETMLGCLKTYFIGERRLNEDGSMPEGMWSGLDENGFPSQITNDQMIAQQEKAGFWGFCEQMGPHRARVHFWYDESKDLNGLELAQHIGHELGHTVTPRYEDSMIEEMKAHSYGSIAAGTFKVVHDLMAGEMPATMSMEEVDLSFELSQLVTDDQLPAIHNQIVELVQNGGETTVSAIKLVIQDVKAKQARKEIKIVPDVGDPDPVEPDED